MKNFLILFLLALLVACNPTTDPASPSGADSGDGRPTPTNVAPAGDIVPAGTPIVTLHRVGGFDGQDNLWEIFSDGQIRQTTTVGTNSEITVTQIPPQDIERMLNDLQSAGFYEISGNFMTPDTCCDRYIYTLTATDGTKSNTIQTIDGSPANTPDAVWQSIDTVQTAIRFANWLENKESEE